MSVVCEALPAAGPWAVWYTVGVLAASSVGQVPGRAATADMLACCTPAACVRLQGRGAQLGQAGGRKLGWLWQHVGMVVAEQALEGSKLLWPGSL